MTERIYQTINSITKGKNIHFERDAKTKEIIMKITIKDNDIGEYVQIVKCENIQCCKNYLLSIVLQNSR
ncbi:MAG: hypothetical protein ACLRFI_02815 [Alphaproteobacteria bacterium]